MATSYTCAMVHPEDGRGPGGHPPAGTGGGMRWFLVGYTACPLLLGLLVAIVERPSVADSVLGLLMAPIAWLVAPLGLIVGMLCGISPGWGPWDGRLVFMGLMAGLVVLVAAGLRLENRNRVLVGGDGTPRVPTARVVTARRAYRLATVAWNQLSGRMLLVIAGAGLFCLGAVGCAMVVATGC